MFVLYRLGVVTSNKLSLGPKENTFLKDLSQCDLKTYRIEEVPAGELHVAEDEMLVSCVHFYRTISFTFGSPFFIKIKQGEHFSDVKG